MGGVPCQRGELFQTPENAWKGGGSIIAANSGGGEIGGLVLVPTRGEPVDRRAMCSGDHTLCGQGLRSLHDGHQIVGFQWSIHCCLVPDLDVVFMQVPDSSTWQHGRSFAAKGRGWSSIGLTRFFLSLSIFLSFLRVGCERFHGAMSSSFFVAASKKRREGQTVLSQRPCHVSHSSQRNRWTPLALPKTASPSVLFAVETRPMSFLASPSQLTSAFPMTWHEMLPAHPTTHLPPVRRPRPPRQARKGPPLPVFPWLHDGCFAAPSSPSPSPSPRLPLQLSTAPRCWDFHLSWGDGTWP